MMQVAAGGVRARRAALALLVLYAVLLGALLARHEMWRDELQAWTLARDSHNLVDLWRHTRYEGHPLLWHAMLMPLAHAVDDPQAMQVAHWVIAVAAAAVVMLAAPFPLWLRTALVCSYYPLYEYGVISRNYALTVLGIWLVCVAVTRHSPVQAAAAGAVAANASPMGFLLAPGICAAIVLDREPPLRRRLVATAGLTVAAAAALVQMLAAADYEHARGWTLTFEPLRVAYLARGYARALLPLQVPGLHFWESSALFPWPPAAGAAGWAWTLVAMLVVGGLLAVAAWTSRRSRRSAAALAVGAASLLAFAYVKFPGAIRHQGFLWIWLVAALWMAVGDGGLTRRGAAWLLAPGLACGLAASAVAAWWDWRAPFSGAECAARSILKQGLSRLPLVAGVDWAASGVAGYLPHGKLIYPAAGRSGSFVLWNEARTRQDRFTPADQVAAARAADRGEGSLLLTNAPLPAGSGCQLRFACDHTIVADESLWGYVCEKSPGEAAP